MSGKTLKELLKDLGCNNVSELARAMGIGVVNLHKAFEVQDVKTGLLEDIARALKISVCDFYPSHPVTHYEITESPIAVAGDINGNNANVSNNNISEKFVGLLEKKDEQIDRLLTIIESLNK